MNRPTEAIKEIEREADYQTTLSRVNRWALSAVLAYIAELERDKARLDNAEVLTADDVQNDGCGWSEIPELREGDVCCIIRSSDAAQKGEARG